MVVGTRVEVGNDYQVFHVLTRCYGDTVMFINTYACEEKTYRIEKHEGTTKHLHFVRDGIEAEVGHSVSLRLTQALETLPSREWKSRGIVTTNETNS